VPLFAAVTILPDNIGVIINKLPKVIEFDDNESDILVVTV
jgi:hypothetical protein